MADGTPRGFFRVTENDRQILVNAAQIAFVREVDGYTSVYFAGAKDQVVNVREPLAVVALLIERALSSGSTTPEAH